MKFKILLIGLSLVFVGCGDNSARSQTAYAQSAPMGANSYDLYYRQFLFETEPCTADKSRFYKFASSLSFSPLSSNSKMYFDLSLYLESPNYIAVLRLLKPRHDVSPNTMEVMETHQLSGKWSVVNETLVAENLGRGHALTYNGRPSIDFYLGAATGVFSQSNTILEKVVGESVPPSLEEGCP